MQNGTKRSLRTGRNRSEPNWSSSKRLTSRRNPANDRANAKTNHDRYMALARAATLAGDTVEAENWHQHAEHYFRLMKEETA
jgi:hypothetical protein